LDDDWKEKEGKTQPHNPADVEKLKKNVKYYYNEEDTNLVW
jgi:hypothetical protein